MLTVGRRAKSDFNSGIELFSIFKARTRILIEVYCFRLVLLLEFPSNCLLPPPTSFLSKPIKHFE